MKLRIPDFLLLLAILIGGVLAWRTGNQRAQLTEKHQGLAQVTGDLPIDDPTKVHILALETGDPLHFAWRVYTPANYQHVLTDHMGNRSSGWSSDPREFIARVRFREDEQGRLAVYTHFVGGSSLMYLGDKPLVDFLRGRWDQVRVERVGARGISVIDPKQPATLLRLTLPETMQDEARKKLDPFTVQRYVPDLLNLQLGVPSPQP